MDMMQEWLDRRALHQINTSEEWVRAEVRRRGYRLMHRRNGQYWLMMADPMTLTEIESWIASDATVA